MGPRATYLPIGGYAASHRYRYESGLPGLAVYKLPHRSGALLLLLGGHSVSEWSVLRLWTHVVLYAAGLRYQCPLHSLSHAAKQCFFA